MLRAHGSGTPAIKSKHFILWAHANYLQNFDLVVHQTKRFQGHHPTMVHDDHAALSDHFQYIYIYNIHIYILCATSICNALPALSGTTNYDMEACLIINTRPGSQKPHAAQLPQSGRELNVTTCQTQATNTSTQCAPRGSSSQRDRLRWCPTIYQAIGFEP